MLEKGKNLNFWKKVRDDKDYQIFRDDLLAMYKKVHRDSTPAVSFREYKFFYENGDRMKFETDYFSKRIRMNILALLSMIYPDEQKYLTELSDVIWAVCDEYTWALPAHVSYETWDHSTAIDLFSSETCFALSEIKELLYDRMDSLLRRRICAEIERRIITPFLNRSFWWETANNNWSAVCTCGVAAAFFYIRPDLAKEQIPRFQANLEHFFQSFHPDGICREGLSYWNYGFGFFVSYADMLNEFTGGDMNLFCDDRVRRIASFQHKAYLRDDIAISFADGAIHNRHHIGLTHFLKHIYPEDVQVLPTAFRDNQPIDVNDVSFRARWTFELRALLWFDPALSTEEGETNAEYYSPDSAWYIRKTPLYSFAAKAGDNAEPHNHNDVGSFIFAANQGQLLCDLGAGEYTKEYFSDNTRYSFLCTRSGGHSVPIVDGCEQKAGAEFCGHMFVQNDVLSIEMADAYDIPELSSLKRQFAFGEDGISVHDNFSFNGKALPITERFITQICPETEGQTLRIGKVSLECGNNWTPTVTCTEWSNHIGNTETVYLIDFNAKKPDVEFFMTISII